MIHKDPLPILKILLNGASYPKRRFSVFCHFFVNEKLARQAMEAYFTDGDKYNLFSKASKNGLDLIMKKLVEEKIVEDVNVGTPSPLWQAVTSGNTNLARWLLQQDNIDVKKPAPDGTTPLIMALIKGQGNQQKCLTYPNYICSFADTLIKELCNGTASNEKRIKVCLTFGRHDLLHNDNLDEMPFFVKREFAQAALTSGKLDSILWLEAQLETGLETYVERERLNILVINQLSKPIQEHFNLAPIPVSRPQSELSLMSSSYPVFNKQIETQWFKGWHPKKNKGRRFANFDFKGTIDVISMKHDIQENVLEPFCCLKTLLTQERNRIELSDVPYTACQHASEKQ